MSMPEDSGSIFDVSFSDLVESVSAIGGNILSWITPAHDLLQKDTSIPWAGANTQEKTNGQPSPVDKQNNDKGGDIFSKTNSWLERNKELVNIGGGMLAGAMQEKSKEDQAKTLAESRMAEIREKEALEREANARYSASVSGIRPTGLIGRQAALKRTNSSSIFNNGKLAGG